MIQYRKTELFVSEKAPHPPACSLPPNPLPQTSRRRIGLQGIKHKALVNCKLILPGIYADGT